MEFSIKSIGKIETPHNDRKTAPIQPAFTDAFGTVIVDQNYQEGLKDLEGFSHIILLYKFHKAKKEKLSVKPYLEKEEKGIFAIRHEERPNNIGLSVVQLVRVEENKILVKGIDVLNGTPLLDIKPFVPKFDCKEIESCRIGWLENKIEENQIEE